MNMSPYGATIETSLEIAAMRSGDLTTIVYRRLFAAHPDMLEHFWRDQTGAIRGEMLARTFEAILDFVGERRYGDKMIMTEIVTHEGYDIPREVFATFFTFVAEGVEEALGEVWTDQIAGAWRQLLVDVALVVRATPSLGGC